MGKIKNIDVKVDDSHSFIVLIRFKDDVFDLLKTVIVWLQTVYCDKQLYTESDTQVEFKKAAVNFEIIYFQPLGSEVERRTNASHAFIFSTVAHF